ncbi:alpha/beta hydrolase family protein [Actinomadura macrotermitis]|uniref:2,6-dihydropseudooxynicotine hydrolase n=1 Tax=Actinomadura macrotermitis TaxID=2585200 RepID=A0A7K0BY52_9ACTN|nr:alpha/beta fold hydrolase [Actinomadura macrotermitis]MQY06099.1 2,6-dihydropseudooxynicotine hydrolase [Actinomadura macrotermitis]
MTRFIDMPGVLSGFVDGNRTRTASAGIDPARYDKVTSALPDLRAWPAAFVRTARELRESGENREAALWFHFATILPHPDRALLGEAAAEAHALTTELGEQVEGDGFSGLLRRPDGAARPPLVVVIPGMDSDRTEFLSVGDALLAQGLAVLAIDGPGQGALAAVSPPDPAYHTVVERALDALDERGFGAVGTLGMSLGGFYSAMAAAHGTRVRAAVCVSGPYRLHWDELPPFVTGTLVQRTGSEAAARSFAGRVDLRGVAPLIVCPLRVVDGDTDVIPGVENGERLARYAPDAEYLPVPGGDHLVANRREAWLPGTARWLADRLLSAP